MATPPIDSLVELISKQGLTNFLNATPVASKPVYIDSSGNLQAADLPFVPTLTGVTLSAAPTVTAASSTAALLDLTGAATADVMTTTVVKDGASGATTFTKAGYIRIKVTDTGDVLTDGFYYIQVGTLT